MIRSSHCKDGGLTGFEFLILLGVIAGMTALFLFHLGERQNSAGERTFPGGLIAESMYVAGDTLQPAGSVYAFPAVSRTVGEIPVKFPNEDAGSLGAIRFVVSLFIGDTGAIDMNQIQVGWNTGKDHEIISRSTDVLLVCPNWTISNKFNLLPGRTADSDDWLEPGEQFEILLCPRDGIPPAGEFTLVLTPGGAAIPLKLSRTAPYSIQPVMNLG